MTFALCAEPGELQETGCILIVCLFVCLPERITALSSAQIKPEQRVTPKTARATLETKGKGEKAPLTGQRLVGPQTPLKADAHRLC